MTGPGPQAASLGAGQRYRPLVPPSLALGLGVEGSSSAPAPVSAPLTETIERGTDTDRIQANDPMCGVVPRQYRQAQQQEAAGSPPGQSPPTRIVGGVTAEVGRFPWLVRVLG